MVKTDINPTRDRHTQFYTFCLFFRSKRIFEYFSAFVVILHGFKNIFLLFTDITLSQQDIQSVAGRIIKWVAVDNIQKCLNKSTANTKL